MVEQSSQSVIGVRFMQESGRMPKLCHIWFPDKHIGVAILGSIQMLSSNPTTATTETRLMGFHTFLPGTAAVPLKR